MSRNGHATGDNRHARTFLKICAVLATILVVGVVTFLNVGSAEATPDATCNPDPGHGLPGCHVDTSAGAETSTTQATTATPAGSESTTEDTTTAAPTTTLIQATESQPSSSDPGAPVLLVDNNSCLNCHSNPDLTMTRDDGSTVSLYVNPEKVAWSSVHRFLDCSTCHTTDPHSTQSQLTKLSLAEKCGSCHEYQYEEYIASVHGVPQTEGNSDPATCTDCHSDDSSPHTVQRVLQPSATTYPKNIADTCAKCHDDPELMGKYGIVEKVYDSYMASFHGKAMSLSSDTAILGQLRTATCVNCHGAHNIKAVDDPDAPVAGMSNLAKTCEQCHPGAGVEFASSFLGHKEANTQYVPQVFWGEKFFYWFTRIVLAGGVLLVALPVGRMIVNRIKGKKDTGEGEPQAPDSADTANEDPGSDPAEQSAEDAVEPLDRKDE